MLRDWLNYLGSYDRVMFGTDWPLAMIKYCWLYLCEERIFQKILRG